MRCRRPSAMPRAAATPSASSGFEPGHDLAPEQLQGAHGVLRREVAEGEDAEKIVRSSFLENLAYLLERGARRSRDERVDRFRGIRLGVVHIRAAELAGQMVDVARPFTVRLAPQPFSFSVRFGDDHVQRSGEEWRRDVRVVAAGVVPVLLPDLAVALEERLAVCEPSEERRVIAVLRGELDGIAVAARKPERWIRPLHGLVVKLHVLALVVEDIAAAGSKEDVERLAVAGARLLDALHSINQGLDGRNTATDAELEPAARELVEHADFVVEAVRVVPGQAEGECAEAQALRALDQRREQHARRGVDRERRALVLGEQVGVKAGFICRCGELELVRVHLARRAPRSFDPVEDAELRHTPRYRRHSPRSASSSAELPCQATRPRSMMVWRSASLIRRSRYLSMTSSVCPACRSRSRHFQISSRTSGARPSVASSRISRCGLVTSARPMASICCSPPESWLPMLPARSASRGKNSSTFAGVQGSVRAERLPANATRFSRTVRLGKICRPSGTSAMPERAMRSGSSRSMRRPRKLIVPPLARVRPMIERTVVVLPMPLRPSRVTASPVLISKFSLKST